MLRFRGFRASLNFSSGKRSGTDYFDDITSVAMTGAYRMNTEEFTENGSFSQHNKGIRPSLVVLPPSPQPARPRRSKNKKNHSKSTNDLAAADHLSSSASHSKSVGNVSLNPRGQSNRDQDVPTNVNTPMQTHKTSKSKKDKSQKESKKMENNTNNAEKESKKAEKESKKAEKELKKIEKEQKKRAKKQLEEQKKRDKLDALEQAKQEKLTKEREKAEAQRIAKEQKIKIENDKKKPAHRQKNNSTKDTQTSLSNPLAQGLRSPNTNTLKSSISQSSAPPPYSETNQVLPKNEEAKVIKQERRKEVVKNESDGTGNTTFGKPIADSGNSWDMVSQHRQQINRTAVGGSKQKILTDSQYITGRTSIFI